MNMSRCYSITVCFILLFLSFPSWATGIEGFVARLKVVMENYRGYSNNTDANYTADWRRLYRETVFPGVTDEEYLSRHIRLTDGSRLDDRGFDAQLQRDMEALSIAKKDGIQTVDVLLERRLYRHVAQLETVLMMMPEGSDLSDDAVEFFVQEKVKLLELIGKTGRMGSSSAAYLAKLDGIRERYGLERMTAEEFEIYRKYKTYLDKTGQYGGYRSVNESLRGYTPNGVPEHLSVEDLQDVAQRVVRSIEMYPPAAPPGGGSGSRWWSGEQFYRYVDWPGAKTLNPNDLFVDRGITHSTMDERFAVYWSTGIGRSSNQHPTFMRITGNKKPHMIAHPFEMEADFPPNTVFRIKEKTTMTAPKSFKAHRGKTIQVIDLEAMTESFEELQARGERVYEFTAPLLEIQEEPAAASSSGCVVQ